MQSHTDSLRAFLRKKNVDAILLSSPLSVRYYTGFDGFSSEEREGYCVVTKTKTYLLTSALYEGAVKKLANIFVKIYSREKSVEELLEQIIDEETLGTLGIETNDLRTAEYLFFKKLIRLVPLNLRHLRAVKTSKEIASIAKACSVADAALVGIKEKIKTGMTELDIAKLLTAEIRKNDADISFRPIVAFSKNAAIPHHVTTDKKLKSNDLILIDFGAKVDGYCSDMTRTFFHGTPTDEQKKVVDVVAGAQQAAIDYVSKKLRDKKKEINADNVDEIARRYIDEQGLPAFPHSLGHGIGLEVHEPPYLGPGSKDILKEGMVFSIEPGVYLPETFGVRIEDLFTIENKALRKLTNAMH